MAPPLICPGCRTLRDGRLELRTLDPVDDPATRTGADALLGCACGRTYPVIDGVPIVLADPGPFLAREATALVERDLPPAVAARLALDGPDDAAYARLLEHLSIYLDAHWGDRATPPAPLAGPALLDRIAARRVAPVATAIELGCSVGRGLVALAEGADHVVGLELQFAALRRARHLLDGTALAYARREIGRHYRGAEVAPGAAPVPAARRTLICGDALDPPFAPAHFDRVVACNLLDSVRHPHRLIEVLDGLCAPGGELLLTSPYAWQSSVVDDDARPGGADPARWLRDLLTGGLGLRARYEVEEEAELPWTLRRDSRTALHYKIHYLRVRKSLASQGTSGTPVPY
jgi:SAM-dependent methyltransferase/uncharacterized protein YbaR (Trm112 family)